MSNFDQEEAMEMLTGSLVQYTMESLVDWRRVALLKISQTMNGSILDILSIISQVTMIQLHAT